MNPEVYWIPGPWRGRLAIVARPRGGDWLGDEIAAWRSAGIDSVVSLLEEEEAAELGLQDERRETTAKRIGFISFPIPDRGTPESLDKARSLIAEIRHDLDGGASVGIHCRQSVGRSGLIAAAVLASSGTSMEQAIDIVSRARGVAIPETAQQREWLRKLPRQLQTVER